MVDQHLGGDVETVPTIPYGCAVYQLFKYDHPKLISMASMVGVRLV